MKNEEYKKLSIAEFTKAAGRSESNHAGIYEMCKKDYPDILEELEKEPFRDLLDAGCGPAPMISLLAEKYPDRHYTGLDLTPAMIEQAKKKDIPNATFVVGDCENVLVIIEGLTMYLCEKDIRKMLSIIERSFQKVTVMVETMSPFVVKHVKEKSIEGSNAKFTWGVKNGTELKKVVPNFSVLQEVSLVEGMKELVPVYCVIGKIPAVRNISNKIIVLEKGE